MTEATGEGVQPMASFTVACLTHSLNKRKVTNICISGHGLLTALWDLREFHDVLKCCDAQRQEHIPRTVILWINVSTEKLQGKMYHNMFTFFNHKATKWSLFSEWVITALVLCFVSVCRKMSARQSKQHDDQPLSCLSTVTNVLQVLL